MRKLKKIILTITCLIMIACLVACDAGDQTTGTPELPNQSEQEASSSPNETPEEDNGGEDDANNNGSNGGSTLPEQGWTDVRK